MSIYGKRLSETNLDSQRPRCVLSRLMNKRAFIKTMICLAILLVHASHSLASGFFELLTVGTVEQVQQALEDGADVNARDADGLTPLMLTVSARQETELNAEIVRLLIYRGADVNIENPPFGTALSWALRLWTTPEAVMSLLDAGADVHSDNALILAVGSRTSAVRNSIPILQRILTEGVEINAVDAIGQTAILSAVRGRASIETLNFLIHNGANTSATLNNNATIWHSYALSYFFYTLRYDLDVPPEGITNEDIFEILKASGVSVNQADERGTTPLMFAAQHGTRRAVSLLIEAGADTALRDIDGVSAYIHAAGSGRLDNADLIFFNGNLFHFNLARILYVLYLLASILGLAPFITHFEAMFGYKLKGLKRVYFLTTYFAAVCFIVYGFWWVREMIPLHIFLNFMTWPIMSFYLPHIITYIMMKRKEKNVLPGQEMNVSSDKIKNLAWSSLTVCVVVIIVYFWTYGCKLYT